MSGNEVIKLISNSIFTGSHPNNVATLRRAQHHHAHQMKPAPPTRRTSSVLSDPPLDSNSTTPRSSLEHLPPPPPHLLHSDDDDPPPPPPPIETPSIIAQRTRSVAESVKALQKSGHMPCSPKNLRRAHSMVGGGSPRPSPPPKSEQIYAPVAHLQQKIQQRQQSHQGPEEYGFGMAFQQSQNHFFQHIPSASEHMGANGMPMMSPPELCGQQGYGSANHDQVSCPYSKNKLDTALYKFTSQKYFS